jgi:ABC-type uncharacterized transport system substrate-binding protein
LLQATRTIPIVFTHVPDPVGAGFIDSMARPGGNATGFTSFDYGLSVKWLELLKEIAPQVTRVGVIRTTELRVPPMAMSIRSASSTCSKTRKIFRGALNRFVCG